MLEDCTFRINKAEWGGALSCRDSSSPEIHRTTFDGNSVAGNLAFGGAVFADYQAKPSFHETTFSDNSASYGGAAACLAASEINLVQCTVAGNTSLAQGGGLFIFDASPQVTSSLITFNEGTGISTAGTAYPVINCTDIYGNSLGDWVGTLAGQAQTGGNLSVDPLYCTQAPGDDSRFFLNAVSPVIQTDCGIMGAKPVVCDLTLTDDPLPPRPGLGTVAAWPNPFNPMTTIKFEIALPQRVRVTVFNLQGARVRALADREFDKGTQNIQWNGEDEGGRMIGSGTYILVVEGRHDRQSRKLTMLK